MKGSFFLKILKLSIITFFFSLLIIPFGSQPLFACGGKDVILNDIRSGNTETLYQYDENGNLTFDRSQILISPARALQVAEFFLTKNIPNPPLPLTFRKLERVHKKIVYQFESEPYAGHNGKYHLGPVNFIVDRFVLDVNAVTGDLYLANGCGSAPGALLSRYDPDDFSGPDAASRDAFVSNNTNFIARKTGNIITVDGKIGADEWQNTGHRYFYLGSYHDHAPSEMHETPYYYAEVWTQADDRNIYFAVKTDSPYWIGLLIKNNPNLGMLGAYRDAKVMTSRGRITDRHFSQRKDKTFFLAPDEQDNIIASGNFQDDFYTYELSFPLRTGDPKDVSLEHGKAYNMLLLIGNTLEHHGIFTLDKAHANHDHSKNNKEHVDVWASNETTFRVGTPAGHDIYGNPVTPMITSFESGFDPTKANNHFHYAETPVKDFEDRKVISENTGLISLIIAVSGFLAIVLGISLRPGLPHQPKTIKFDLLRIRLIRRFVSWKHFRHIFSIPTLIIFFIIIILGFFDIQDGQKNIATVFTWTLWWSLIIFSFIFAGRFWCMMCPFAYLADLAQRFISFNRTLPGWLQNMGFQIFAFIFLTWAFTAMAFSRSPIITSLVIVVILAAAVLFSVIYQRRSFCRHLCPIGAVIGIYSMVAPIELRTGKETVCTSHANKTCTGSCPMLENPNTMENNIYCNYCMECLSACPSGNLSLRLRAFGEDIYKAARKAPAEAAAALFLIGVVIVETLSMTSSWIPLQNYLGTLLRIESPTVLYTLTFALVLLLPVGLFYALCSILRAWLGRTDYSTFGLVSRLAFLFVPLGIAIHLAHNIQHLLLEGSIAVPATLRMIQSLGILSSLSPDWNPLPVLGTEPIFYIQMGTIIAGFIFTFFILYRLLIGFHRPVKQIYKVAFVMSLYALVVVLSGIYMLGLPMSGRHIH